MRAKNLLPVKLTTLFGGKVFDKADALDGMSAVDALGVVRVLDAVGGVGCAGAVSYLLN
ncbi:hypothetical protein [Bartonella gliris]|uniref:hypothetical protein n=1 Tax=Bartonella gliris TaxID=3004109 RepID=UPI00295F0377|nr:hypothetical protein [Bartonella gliris]